LSWRISSNRFVTSRMMAMIATIAPELSSNGMIVNSIEIVAPFLCTAGTESTSPSPYRAFAGRHRAAISLPVAAAQTLRNDEVKGMADRVGGGMAKNTLRARIPKANQAVAITGDDRFRACAQQRFGNQF